jgi:hypothetical protein
MPTRAIAAAVNITQGGTPSASLILQPDDFFPHEPSPHFSESQDDFITGQPPVLVSDLQHFPAIVIFFKISI